MLKNHLKTKITALTLGLLFFNCIYSSKANAERFVLNQSSLTQQQPLKNIQNYWGRYYIENLISQKIINGFPDGTYRPNAPITRAEFASIIGKAFTPSPKQGSVNFTDVSNNYWAYQAIQTAVKGGFLTGYPNGLFLPNQRISKVEMLVALANGLGLKAEDTKIISKYPDAKDVPSYAQRAVAAAIQKDLIPRDFQLQNNLYPNKDATRGEVAASIFKALVSTRLEQAAYKSCLPSNIKITDFVSSISDTVEQRLKTLKAFCNDQGKLVDASAKEIKFYNLTGCWGNAPANYQEILERQRDEINKLSQTYTVLEMSCNPSGIPIP
jgi:hypothetical protein